MPLAPFSVSGEYTRFASADGRGWRLLAELFTMLKRAGASQIITYAAAGLAGAQGQVRAADRELLEMLNAFGDPDADAAVRAERALLGELHGGCSVPVGALATRRDGVLSLSAQVTSLDGRERVACTATGAAPEAIGAALAATLRERGADAILDKIREPAAR